MGTFFETKSLIPYPAPVVYSTWTTVRGNAAPERRFASARAAGSGRRLKPNPPETRTVRGWVSCSLPGEYVAPTARSHDAPRWYSSPPPSRREA